MKAKEIYENALALSISHPDDEDDMEYYAVKLINIILTEVFMNNNQIREKKGKKPLDKATRISNMDEELGCEDELYAALSYALASKLLQAQEEHNLAAIYNNQYVTLLELITPAVKVEVV